MLELTSKLDHEYSKENINNHFPLQAMSKRPKSSKTRQPTNTAGAKPPTRYNGSIAINGNGQADVIAMPSGRGYNGGLPPLVELRQSRSMSRFPPTDDPYNQFDDNTDLLDDLGKYLVAVAATMKLFISYTRCTVRIDVTFN